MKPTRNQARRAAARKEQARRRAAAPRQAYDHDTTHRTLAAALPVTVELGNVPGDIDPNTLAAAIRETLAHWTNEPEHWENTTDTLSATIRQNQAIIRATVERLWRERMSRSTPELSRLFRAACLKRWQSLETANRIPWLSIRPGTLEFSA